MKTALFMLLAVFASITSAQVLQVDIWKSKPGQEAKTIAYAKEGQAIGNKLGGNIMVGQDISGDLHYVSNHENWAAWAALTAISTLSRCTGMVTGGSSACAGVPSRPSRSRLNPRNSLRMIVPPYDG